MRQKSTRDLAHDLRSRLANNAVAGGWLMDASPLAVESMAEAGVGFIGIDLQHAVNGGVAETLHNCIRAADLWKLPTVVRVPWSRPEYAMQVLDAGAAGIIFPMIDDADQATVAAEWCRFPPLGRRSWGPVRASSGDSHYVPSSANSDILCFMMVETVAGAQNARAIAEVPGVDGVYVGPTDLTISHYGELPSARNAEAESLIANILESVASAGTFLGTPVADANEFLMRANQGFTLIPVSSDMGLIKNGLHAELDRISVNGGSVGDRGL